MLPSQSTKPVAHQKGRWTTKDAHLVNDMLRKQLSTLKLALMVVMLVLKLNMPAKDYDHAHAAVVRNSLIMPWFQENDHAHVAVCRKLPDHAVVQENDHARVAVVEKLLDHAVALEKHSNHDLQGETSTLMPGNLPAKHRLRNPLC